jgi:hypothetical protein
LRAEPLEICGLTKILAMSSMDDRVPALIAEYGHAVEFGVARSGGCTKDKYSGSGDPRRKLHDLLSIL